MQNAVPILEKNLRDLVMRRVLPLLSVLFAGSAIHATEPDRASLDFFEARIRPMLVTHCYECHSGGAVARQNLKGGLLLDSREGSRTGGESGPAVVPGKPDESLLISALRQESFEMPPQGKLPDEIIADFVKWVEMGAPDPREGGSVNVASEIDLEAGRQHWAFQPLTSPSPPDVEDTAWVRTPVDQFVRAKQEAADVEPNAIADARTLLRRAYFDLIGLPPAPDVVNQFVEDSRSDPHGAYERLVDELLQSAHYGERWARHWLDITRFAESHGYAFDGDRPHAWHYRDFVIRALNSDMPYDEFVRLQIAGDLLTSLDVQTTEESQAAVHTIAATGFLVAGPFTTQQTQKERERSRYEQLDDIVSTLGTSLLGLTVGCSRCHSHKFDPLPQFDYYRLASCFADVGFSNTGVKARPEAFREAMAAFDADHAPLVAERARFEQQRLPERLDQWAAASSQDLPLSSASLTLSEWRHAGPFAAESSEKAYEEAFEPEQAVDLAATDQDGNPRWTPKPDWNDGTVHNPFTTENAANYLFREIETPEDVTLSLSLGSDDAIKVWVNGEEVLAKQVGRGAAPDQEVLQVPIQQGTNTVLMKIVNGTGPSGFYFAATTLQPQTPRVMGRWQHIGPFTTGGFDESFSRVFPPELDTNLAQSFGDGSLQWTEQPDWKDGEAHNDKLTGANCANYLFREIYSAAPQVLALSLGSDDGIKLWVNGREVLSKKVRRNVAAAGQETATIQLAAGRNELLMKIVNGGGETGFYFAASPAPAPADITAILRTQPDQWDDQQRKRAAEWHQGFDLDWLRLNQIVARHEAQRPTPDLTEVFAARVRGTTYQFGDDTYKVYHLRRGNADNKEQEATPGFLRVLMRTDDQDQQWLRDPADAEQPRPGRLGLADWLTDQDQGAGRLLARVIVNRLWHHHFGRGIVATPSDFGTRGERPSHPELLDWLAGELIRNGWKLKPVHKLIMTSSVYMQGGDVTASGGGHDPENLLLWRRNARRLEAEIIRDSLLAVSGSLDRTMLGKGTLDENSRRRSIYFTVKRSQLIKLLQLFDAPGTMQGIGSREESTVAPQALALLNSPFVRDVAGRFAARIRPDADVPVNEAIERAYQVALTRPPTDEERAVMVEFIQRQQESREADADAESLAVRDFCHLMLCMNEFVYID